jgi:hypothetical protein
LSASTRLDFLTPFARTDKKLFRRKGAALTAPGLCAVYLLDTVHSPPARGGDVFIEAKLADNGFERHFARRSALSDALTSTRSVSMSALS